MRSFVEVIGCGTHDCSSSLQIFFDDARYLFECGDGTQRLCTEYGTKLSRLRGIYLSSLSAPSIGGLFGLMLTIADAGKQKVSLSAPTGLAALFNNARSFCYRPSLAHTIHEINLQSRASSSPVTVTHDENVTIQAVPINSRRDIEIDTSFGAHFDSVSYICKIRDIRGKFDPQRAQQLGVKKGRLFGLLQKGENVTLDDGSIVKSADVMSPDTPGPVILIISCPSKHHIPCLVSSPALHPNLLQISTPSGGSPRRICIIYHLASKDILCDSDYRTWSNQFGNDTTHITLHSSMSKSQVVFLSQAEDLALLHHSVDKDIFPLPKDIFDSGASKSSESDPKEPTLCLKSTYSLSNEELISAENDGIKERSYIPFNEWSGNWVTAECKMRFNLAPAASVGLDRSLVRKMFLEQTESPIERNWKNVVPEGGSEPAPAGYDLETPDCIARISAGKTMVRFLGTGAAIPGKHRNVSGIMLDLFERGGILLDCGEGTWGQMVRMMGLEQAQRAVASLRIIFVSHMHADHHLGLLSVLHHREEAIRERRELDHGPQLILIGPGQLQEWLQAFEAAAQVPLLDQVRPDKRSFRFFDAQKLTDPQAVESRLFSDTFGLELGCVEVIHCLFSYGVVIRDLVHGWKVVYSGDTRPCRRLAEAGKDATLAIHEATLDDNLSMEAKEKMHCTTGEALKVCSEDMRAWRTILTHFSQRYPKIPRLTDETVKLLYRSRAAVAMDMMCVDFTRLCELPRVVSAMRDCFPEEAEVPAFEPSFNELQ